MSIITREQLRERAREKVKSLEFAVTQTAFADSCAELEEELELARIALESLEAEAVSVFKIDHESSLIKHVKKVVSETNAPQAPVSVKDHQIRELVNELRDIAVEYHGTQQLRERIARTVRAAMLQGAKNAESRCSNSPVIPDGWKLVPIELTGDMTNAMSEAILDDLHNVDVWRSVLAAAPQQEVK
ncbi:hypothetical protein B1H42_06090 [Enterobacter cloacae subsp. cloacae]|uniref:hypothetical protein n=1 Tax=Enterobacter cloacae TaxID=550 RepID=UPI000A0B3DDE|nr:hypothetical protein [Enterobacter cloacae]ORC23932.1 hypothetical protein B1H42_06090 [Enterobacter cloacae subsp. cloacae]ORC32016.1 hypothetical protein B2M05_04720 [Enterobacter cloacae subsp. cloacae]